MAIRELNLTVQVVDKDVPGSCSAVVVKVIVTVGAVLRLIVFIYRLNDSISLRRSDIELLLHNPPALTAVFLHEYVEWYDAHLIIGQAEDEAQDEVLLLEREHTIVHYDVACLG